ncbi:hypothetical protein JG688_00015432, partial [Phytophthora aleatoria]
KTSGKLVLSLPSNFGEPTLGTSRLKFSTLARPPSTSTYPPPRARIWAGRERRDAAQLWNTSKHAGRMTAVLTIRADGKKNYPFCSSCVASLGVASRQTSSRTIRPDISTPCKKSPGWTL